MQLERVDALAQGVAAPFQPERSRGQFPPSLPIQLGQMSESEDNPIDLLLPYQKRWLADESRFKVGMWSRQVGKSLACAFEAVDNATETGQDWLIISAGERQVKEFIRKVASVAQIYGDALGNFSPVITATEVVLPWSGAKITGIPSNPATARGYSRNVVLDEAAFQEQSEELWRAIYPIITNPLKGDLKVRVISTPSGKNNLFYKLWTSEGKKVQWSKHKLDIYDAIREGLEVDIDELREGMDDPDGWAQEFECQFLEEATQFLTYDLINSCVDVRATLESLYPRFDNGTLRYGGGDVGRHRDLSCAWMLKCDPKDNLLVTESVDVMERMVFESQQEIFGKRIKLCARFAVDASGIGEETAERLAQKWGAGKVLGCKLTNEFKNEIMVTLKDQMQKGFVRIPDCPKLKASLASIQKRVTEGGTVRYVAAHTADGHADEAIALALAVWAARKQMGAMTKEQAKGVPLPNPTFRPTKFTF